MTTFDLDIVLNSVTRGLNKSITDLKSLQKEADLARRTVSSIGSRSSVGARTTRDMSRLKGVVDSTTMSVKGLQKSMQGLQADFSATGTGGKGLIKDLTGVNLSIADATVRFTAYTIVLRGVAGALSAARDDALKFERELVRVAQLSNRPIGAARELGNEITRLSSRFGTSSGELLRAAQTFTQAGKSLSETRVALNALAPIGLAANFSDAASTTKNLLATLKQFRLEVGQTTEILDSFNAISKETDVSTQELFDGIKRGGTIFAALSGVQENAIGDSRNLDRLREFGAIFASIISTTRESAETIGTSLRTIIPRLARRDVLEALEGIGANVRDLEGDFVGPTEAFRELARVVGSNDFQNPAIINLLETLGGSRQIGRTAAAITGAAEATRLLNVARNSQGSLAEDVAKAEDNLQVRLDKLAQSFNAFTRDVLNSNTFQELAKTLLDVADSAVQVARSVAQAADSFGPLLTVLLAVSGARFAGGAAFRGARSFLGFNKGGITSRGDRLVGLTRGEVAIYPEAQGRFGGAGALLAHNNRFNTGGRVGPGMTKLSNGIAMVTSGSKANVDSVLTSVPEGTVILNRDAANAFLTGQGSVTFANSGGMIGRQKFMDGGFVTQDFNLNVAKQAANLNRELRKLFGGIQFNSKGLTDQFKELGSIVRSLLPSSQKLNKQLIQNFTQETSQDALNRLLGSLDGATATLITNRGVSKNGDSFIGGFSPGRANKGNRDLDSGLSVGSTKTRAGLFSKGFKNQGFQKEELRNLFKLETSAIVAHEKTHALDLDVSKKILSSLQTNKGLFSFATENSKVDGTNVQQREVIPRAVQNLFEVNPKLFRGFAAIQARVLRENPKASPQERANISRSRLENFFSKAVASPNLVVPSEDDKTRVNLAQKNIRVLERLEADLAKIARTGRTGPVDTGDPKETQRILRILRGLPPEDIGPGPTNPPSAPGTGAFGRGGGNNIARRPGSPTGTGAFGRGGGNNVAPLPPPPTPRVTPDPFAPTGRTRTTRPRRRFGFGNTSRLGRGLRGLAGNANNLSIAGTLIGGSLASRAVNNDGSIDSPTQFATGNAISSASTSVFLTSLLGIAGPQGAAIAATVALGSFVDSIEKARQAAERVEFNELSEELSKLTSLNIENTSSSGVLSAIEKNAEENQTAIKNLNSSFSNILEQRREPTLPFRFAQLAAQPERFRGDEGRLSDEDIRLTSRAGFFENAFAGFRDSFATRGRGPSLSQGISSAFRNGEFGTLSRAFDGLTNRDRTFFRDRIADRERRKEEDQRNALFAPVTDRISAATNAGTLALLRERFRDDPNAGAQNEVNEGLDFIQTFNADIDKLVDSLGADLIQAEALRLGVSVAEARKRIAENAVEQLDNNRATAQATAATENFALKLENLGFVLDGAASRIAEQQFNRSLVNDQFSAQSSRGVGNAAFRSDLSNPIGRNFTRELGALELSNILGDTTGGRSAIVDRVRDFSILQNGLVNAINQNAPSGELNIEEFFNGNADRRGILDILGIRDRNNPVIQSFLNERGIQDASTLFGAEGRDILSEILDAPEFAESVRVASNAIKELSSRTNQLNSLIESGVRNQVRIDTQNATSDAQLSEIRDRFNNVSAGGEDRLTQEQARRIRQQRISDITGLNPRGTSVNRLARNAKNAAGDFLDTFRQQDIIRSALANDNLSNQQRANLENQLSALSESRAERSGEISRLEEALKLSANRTQELSAVNARLTEVSQRAQASRGFLERVASADIGDQQAITREFANFRRLESGQRLRPQDVLPAIRTVSQFADTISEADFRSGRFDSVFGADINSRRDLDNLIGNLLGRQSIGVAANPFTASAFRTLQQQTQRGPANREEQALREERRQIQEQQVLATKAINELNATLNNPENLIEQLRAQIEEIKNTQLKLKIDPIKVAGENSLKEDIAVAVVKGVRDVLSNLQSQNSQDTPGSV